MKLLVLYLKTLKSFLQTNIIASVVLIVSITFVFLSSMFCINAFMSYKSALSGYYRMITITCNYNGNQNQLDFLELPQKILAKESDNVENIVFRYDDDEIVNSILSLILHSYDSNEIESYDPVNFTVVSYYYNGLNEKLVSNGQNISNENVNNSDCVLVYNKSIFTVLIKQDGHTINIPNIYQIGDNIKIVNKEYRIVGTMSNFGYSIIPYTTGLKSLKLRSIDINLKKNVTDKHKKSISEFLSSEYKGLDVSMPPNIDQELLRKISLELFLLGFSCFIALFYLLYIYKFIIESNKKTLIINRILGLSIRKSILMNLFQVFLINTLLYVIVVLLYRYIIVRMFNLYIPDTSFLIYIYLFVIVTSSLIIYPFSKKICNKIGIGG